ncbi:MAG TPA: prolyl oligopeptidase family serine peptidase [Pyrinomonadaceae bacterium]|jgi:prolyl oligopeptidase|nr:prolyl oligopeptidase family serine peptidase [Pyrinomonadaceae bacterium]
MLAYSLPRVIACVCLFLFFAVAINLGVRAQNSTTGASQQMMKTNTYPPAKKGIQVDDYHGVKVADPYRWLEDLDSNDTRNWVAAENKLTFGFLEAIPARSAIKDRITKLWNYEKYSVPFKEGKRYFYSRNSGLQNQSVLYTVTSLDGQPQLVLDPNTLSTDGTVALSGMQVSNDGKLLAYSLSASGSDWQEWKVRDVETGKDRSDDLKWVKFSGVSWMRDDSGFFYSRYDEPKGDSLKATNYFQKVYFHKLGTTQSEDQLVYERPDQKDWLFGGFVTEDGNYLIITVYQGTDTKTRVYYKRLKNSDKSVIRLLDDFDAAYTFIGNEGARFWFQTDLKSPRGKIIEIDITKPARENWKVVIPESKESLQTATLVNHRFILNYLKDAYTQVRIHDPSGKLVNEVQFPGIGSADGFGGKSTDIETFYSFTGFTTPTTIYRYEMTGKSSVFRQPKVDFNPGDFETKQVFYTSKDGTSVPMFITHKKGLKLDGNNPTYLYGYGGFNVSLSPAFSVGNLVWMEMGGVYAQPNLRGGGEYGEDWHQGGMKLKKQNVFDDFIAAAEWLIQNKYTSTPKLSIGGGSNGGLLVGAAMTQRPELFGAAVPAVGVMDMLRFQTFTIGWAWVSDYGSSENPEDFKALYAYSPLHNIKPGTSYPATLVTTADHDDRVWPGHSFKFAATLQAAQAGSAPVLIRIETKAGHGAGKPTSKTIEEIADRWAFLVRTLEMKS